MEEQKNGLVIVDKPKSMTSHDVVDVARKSLGTRRIGHIGTLDPHATGVLVLCVNQRTKSSPIFEYRWPASMRTPLTPNAFRLLTAQTHASTTKPENADSEVHPLLAPSACAHPANRGRTSLCVLSAHSNGSLPSKPKNSFLPES